MIFLFGEKLRSRSAPVGVRHCVMCRAEQPFSEHVESLWFSFFSLPVLPIEDKANYLRCEKCLAAYAKDNLNVPSHVPIIQTLIVYLLLGYQQDQHRRLAEEICLKITGAEFSEDDYHLRRSEVATGTLDMVELVRTAAPTVNAIGKQQIIEAAFLTTYVCCDLQYEDRLRINLMGNSLDLGLEFVDYAIQQTRKQSYYGVKRLRTTEAEV